MARARAGPPKGVITAEGEMREVLKGRKREGGIEAGGGAGRVRETQDFSYFLPK